MDTYLPVAALIALGALTPGPNNLVALDAGTRGGLAAALPPIAGVVAGSLVMLGLVAAGLAQPLASPAVRMSVALAGAAYLAWLGLRLLRTAGTPMPAKSSLPRGAAGLFAFQFANPKAWMLAATVVAIAPAPDAMLFGLYAAIPALSLLAWAGAGAALARWFDAPARRRRVDLANGALLLVFAASFALEHVAGGAR